MHCSFAEPLYLSLSRFIKVCLRVEAEKALQSPNTGVGTLSIATGLTLIANASMKESFSLLLRNWTENS